MTAWRDRPEIRLVMWALPLEAVWEIAQLPLYTLWHKNEWGYILYNFAHCTLGDLLILLVSFELMAWLTRDRYWFKKHVLFHGVLFTLAGAGYTIYSEIRNVYFTGAWAYTERMPIVPVIGVGLAPLLQWLLLPPLLLYLLRRVSTARVMKPLK